MKKIIGLTALLLAGTVQAGRAELVGSVCGGSRAISLRRDVGDYNRFFDTYQVSVSKLEPVSELGDGVVSSLRAYFASRDADAGAAYAVREYAQAQAMHTANARIPDLYAQILKENNIDGGNFPIVVADETSVANAKARMESAKIGASRAAQATKAADERLLGLSPEAFKDVVAARGQFQYEPSSDLGPAWKGLSQADAGVRRALAFLLGSGSDAVMEMRDYRIWISRNVAKSELVKQNFNGEQKSCKPGTREGLFGEIGVRGK